MKIDLYTKTVLTLIAASLLYLSFSAKKTTVHADGPTPVIIVGVAGKGVLPVGLRGTAYIPDPSVPGLPADGHWEYVPIPVKVVSQNAASERKNPK